VKFEDGWPRFEGSTDRMDSAMLNSVMFCFKHPKAIDPKRYIHLEIKRVSENLYEVGEKLRVVRCPKPLHEKDWCANWKNCTLDQMIPVLAALDLNGDLVHSREIALACKNRGWLAQNSERDMPGSTKYPYPHFFRDTENKLKFRFYDGPDRILLAQREFMTTIIDNSEEDYWLDKYISFHASWTPLAEPNQLTTMMLASNCPEMYVARWKFRNPRWRECISGYYKGSARNDPEFADYQIAYLEKLI
jgi:hypothetical protein